MRPLRQEIGGLGNMIFKEAYIWAQMRGGKIPDIYVQSSKYWQDYKEEIRQRFSSGVGHDNRVAFHIRRGDYLKVSQFHVNLWDTDYYKNAIKLFSPDTKFLIFCKDNQGELQDWEDREWCIANIPSLGIDFEMKTHRHETEDLTDMASCQGMIGANSSFSWWGAFLNPHNGLKVFPKEDKWFTDGKIRIELEKEWIQI